MTKDSNRKGLENYLALFGVALSVIYWIVETCVDTFVFHQGSFSKQLLPFYDPGETYMRLFICILIVIFSIYAQHTIDRRRRMEKERSDMLSMFAHDMKSPIISALGFLSRLLSGKAGTLDDKQTAYLEIIREEFKVLEKLITDFLEFSRFEANEYKPQLMPVDIKTELYKNIEIARMAAAGKDVAILCEIAENIPDTINVDSALVNRLLNNLLDNAIKYSRHGDFITVRLSGRDDDILVQVTDKGAGIPEEHIPYIFDPFYLASTDSKGSGLGLAIARKIVEEHGGKIWVESLPGQGSIFNFTLPKR